MGARRKSERPGKGGSRSRGPSRGSPHRLPSLFAVVIVLLLWAAVGRTVLSGGSEPSPLRPDTAVIVDQLSLTAPNPRFVASATDTLEEAGYSVDYYPGEEVTVDLYRDLQTAGYELIIFRAHSSRLVGEWAGNLYAETAFFTSEPYDRTEYVEEQRGGRLVQVAADVGSPVYFGVGAEFVRSSMRGSFEGSTVIMMGCNGLLADTTAQSFLDRGAVAAITWDKDVSAVHTDAATERLLQLLALQGMTPEQAVAQAAADIGPDPVFGAQLRVLTRRG